MSKHFLTNYSLPRFLGILAGCGELHGPTLSDDGVAVFGKIERPEELHLEYSRTLLPPKKYLLPPRETILTYSSAKGYRPPTDNPHPIILIGLHPCDLAGIAYLDRVFLGEEPDLLYLAKRQALTLVGISCEPDEHCFCGAVGADQPIGCDLYLQQEEKGFSLACGTPAGDALFKKLAPLLSQRDLRAEERRDHPLASSIREACENGESFADSPLWDAFADRCLSCGACSLCCPTCYCFDVFESGLLDQRKAERLRVWDNCLFKTHGEVAGGFNFHKGRRERFQYRYRHKYLGFGPLASTVSCVGCGRCREVCPVRIDLLELFHKKHDDRQ